MKDINQVLKTLGLADSERKTYLAALQHGPSTVIDLVKYTNLSRQASYLAVDSLTKRGLMSSVEHGKKNHYAAEAPSKLLAYARRKQHELDEEISDLEKMLPELELRAGGAKPSVRSYEGKEGVRALIEDMVESGVKKMDEISDLEAMYSVLTLEDLKPLRNKLKRLNSRVRGLYAGIPSPKVVDVDRVILPAQLSKFNGNVSIYKNKVALVTFEGNIHSVIIENEALATTMRILFDGAFEHYKKQ